MRRLLLLLLLPLALSVEVPVEAVRLTIACGEEVPVYYMASGGDITFFFTEANDLSVHRAFLVYHNLLSVYDRLSFINLSTVTSLRSLSSELEDYGLQLLQAKSLLERYGVSTDLSEINRLRATLEKSFRSLADDVEDYRSRLEDFLSAPSCDIPPPPGFLGDMEDLYLVGDRLLKEVQRVRTELSSEENIDLGLVSAVSKLLEPPFSRPDLDELLSRARSDGKLLDSSLNPREEDVLKLAELSETYYIRSRVEEILSGEISSGIGVFPSLGDAVTFIVLRKDDLRYGDRAKEVEAMYREVLERVEKGDFRGAYSLVTRLKDTLQFVLDGGWKEEEVQEPDYTLPVLFLLLLGAIIFVLLRRRKGDEEGLDAYDDLDGLAE